MKGPFGTEIGKRRPPSNSPCLALLGFNLLTLFSLCLPVSTTWGFPQVCPEGCSCQCFDCSKPECRCALPEGFCDMLPATMLVDYVSPHMPSALSNMPITRISTRMNINGEYAPFITVLRSAHTIGKEPHLALPATPNPSRLTLAPALLSPF